MSKPLIIGRLETDKKLDLAQKLKLYSILERVDKDLHDDIINLVLNTADYQQGYDTGYRDGRSDGNADTWCNGKAEGYEDGYRQCKDDFYNALKRL